MRVNAKVESLEKKSYKQLWALEMKYLRKIRRLDFILKEIKVFNVPMSEISLDYIKDKKEFYWEQIRKISRVRLKKIETKKVASQETL